MKILVFQHLAVEHPGVFRDFFREHGILWDAVELDSGVPIPSLDGYDALWVMGGPMDVWETDLYPWLIPEKAAIREAVVERRLPFLGICLGHQLLADALGGSCRKMAAPEIGVHKVILTDNAAADPLFQGLPATKEVLQWHAVEVAALPPGATVLATSPACSVQAMRVGDRAWGVQYHVEITATTVTDWSSDQGYRCVLQAALGPDGVAAIEAACAARMAAFHRNAKRLFDNFMAATTA